MAGPRVRRLRTRDIEVAIALTDLEAWGYTHADFERLLALSPEGCFAVEDQGRVVGVLTTTSYDKLAFLGAVILRPEYRGRGYGRLLMEEALEHLSRSGIETVRLNAYLNVVPFYERLGFRGEYEVVRWSGRATGGTSPEVRPVGRGEVSRVAAFDAPFFGASRKALLDRLSREMPDTFLVAADRGRILGYIVGSLSGEACEIGPWVTAAGHPDLARRLFQNLTVVAGAQEYAFSGPVHNPDLVRFAQEGGFREAFRTLRMWWGKDRFPGDPAGLWAAAGLEKG